MADERDRERIFEADTVQLTMMEFWVSIFRDYRSYIVHKDLHSLELAFNSDAFVRSNSSDIRSWIRQVVDSSAFQNFMQVRSLAKRFGCCRIEKNF